MNRREAILVAAGSVASISTANAAILGTSSIIIQAPFDVIVTKVTPSGLVKSGQPLVELRAFELDHWDVQLSLHSQHLDIVERPFRDGRVDNDIELIQKTMKLRKDEFDVAQNAFRNGGLDPYNLGTVQSPELRQAQAALEDAERRYLSAKLEADQADQRKKDSLDKIALGRSKLDQQKRLLDEMRKALIIAAPWDGTFNSLTAVGFASKKGHTLGEFV
jgi:multidrug resistance efflux pump